MHTKLTEAFKLMRKRGLLAKQNYKCCSGCAGYALACEAEKLVQSGRKTKDEIKGCCFYHRQDAARLRGGENLFLGYGPMDTKECGEIGLPTEEVGKVVCACLREAGLDCQWDGNPDTRILVATA